MKQIILIFTLIFCVWGGALSVEAQADANATWREAVRQYRKEHYLDARKAFESLVEQGYHSGDLYYNLGNTYVKLHQYPKAMLMYERALKERPGMKDARENLKSLREEMDTDIIELKPFFLSRWWQGWLGLLPPNAWAGISALLFLVIGWLAWRYLEKRVDGARNPLILAVVLAGVFIASAYGSYRMHSRRDTAVVLPDTVPLYEGPDSRSHAATEVPPGIKVTIIDSIGHWYKVALPDRQLGWMPDSVVIKI